ncbi:DUF4453 domain-containing protein [Gymnodinialimonas hymeniacidonis]|uniref:DUF4453 domain-containing protein n=1 Tax=Gymnodinialimonas hymeniacidonis TaxID=3126508 RepID=UPI0034C64845
MVEKHTPLRLCAVFVASLMGAASITASANAEGGAWCQELWLGRNTVMDRAGHCFETPLGQAIFDNSNCTPGERPLTPLDQFIIAEYLEIEAQGRCDVDTSTTELDPIVDRWRQELTELWTVPIRADTEHGCGGYSGPVRELHSGMSNSTTVIGHLRPGDSFGFSHLQMPGGWEYIGVFRPDRDERSHGWVQGIEMTEDVCEWMAG